MESTATKSKSLRKCEFLGTNPQDGGVQSIKTSLPMKHQEVRVQITNVIAVIDVVQTYFNDSEIPLEVTLMFPIEKDHALGKLTIQIGDTIIEGKIMSKDKAEEKYENAMSGGHTAVMVQESEEHPELVRIKVGNLLPLQEAIVHFQLLQALKLENGSYCMRIPQSFFPTSKQEYLYTFTADIKSDKSIIQILCPSNSKILEQPSIDGQEPQKHYIINREPESGLEINKDIVIYYRINSSEEPIFTAQKSDSHPDEVALMISFAPSFFPLTDAVALDTAFDERPQPDELPPALKEKHFFVFIVDRSGSMEGSKMETTKEALVLFLKSLPSDSMFEVISFGNSFNLLSEQIRSGEKICKSFAQGNCSNSDCKLIHSHKFITQEQCGLDYNDQNVEEACTLIKQFQANQGGTEIYEPLERAIQLVSGSDQQLKKTIFLLTDGEVSQPERVIELAKSQTEANLCSIHTFGIGLNCSNNLVESVAKVGRGLCSLILDNQELSSIVIQALARSQEPQYSNCSLKFNQAIQELTQTRNSISMNIDSGFEIFRNDLLICLGIMKLTDFEKLEVNLTSDVHPVTGQSLTKQWSKDDFTFIISTSDELFKIVARSKIVSLTDSSKNNNSYGSYSKNDNDIKELSLKYQVMSKVTAFLGINKNDEKPTEALKQVTQLIRQNDWRNPLYPQQFNQQYQQFPLQQNQAFQQNMYQVPQYLLPPPPQSSYYQIGQQPPYYNNFYNQQGCHPVSNFPQSSQFQPYPNYYQNFQQQQPQFNGQPQGFYGNAYNPYAVPCGNMSLDQLLSRIKTQPMKQKKQQRFQVESSGEDSDEKYQQQRKQQKNKPVQKSESEDESSEDDQFEIPTCNYSFLKKEKDAYTVLLENKLKFNVLKGDITDLSFDAITNPANNQLNHRGGVSGEMLREAGEKLQKESTEYIQKHGNVKPGNIAVTESYKLKKIKIGDKYKFIEDAITNTLQAAEDNKCHSLAIHSISTNTFGCPVKFCAIFMFNAIIKYSMSRKGQESQFLRAVTIIDIDSNNVRFFETQFNYCFKKFDSRFNKNNGRHVTPPRDIYPPQRAQEELASLLQNQKSEKVEVKELEYDQQANQEQTSDPSTQAGCNPHIQPPYNGQQVQANQQPLGNDQQLNPQQQFDQIHQQSNNNQISEQEVQKDNVMIKKMMQQLELKESKNEAKKLDQADRSSRNNIISDNETTAADVKAGQKLIIDCDQLEALNLADSKTQMHGAVIAIITGSDLGTGQQIEEKIPLTDLIQTSIHAENIVEQEVKESIPMKKVEVQYSMSYSLKSFEDLVMAQSSTQGFWKDLSIISCFFKNPESAQTKIKMMLDEDVVKDQRILSTLLALYVFQTKFEDREDEWKLIAQKAYKFLKQNGIAKSEVLLNTFQEELK